MSYCPYCKESIEENWSFCHHCNKPLIVNVGRGRSHGTIQEAYIEPEISIDEDIITSNEIQDKNIDQKISEIDETLTEKETLGESVGLLLLEKSSLYYKKRNLPMALKILEMALNSFTEEKDDLNMAICHNEIGLIHEESGFFDDAIYHFELAIEMLKRLKDSRKLIQVFNNIANVYFLLRNLEKSYDYYQQALNLTQVENFIFDEVKCSNNLVDVLFVLKNYSLIAKILERNLEFFKQNNDNYGIIVTTIKHGKLFYFLGEKYYNLAYEKLTEALELIDKVSDQISDFVKAQLGWEGYLYLGKLKLLWDSDIEAENLLLESLQAIRTFQINENINEGTVLEALAELYKVKGEDEKSIEYYNLSADIYYKFGDDSKYAELKEKISQIYLDFLENEIKAIENLETALELYEELNYTKKSADILHKLGDIYINQGKIDIALSDFGRAKDYYIELEDSINIELIKEKINSLKS